MKAIVLTFDPQIGFVELLHKQYSLFWPSCPLHFVLSYNSDETIVKTPYLLHQPNIEFRKSKNSIRSSMEVLLDGCGENEWVYWCIDDRYPYRAHFPAALPAVYTAIRCGELDSIPAVKLTRWRETITSQFRVIGGAKFFHQSNHGLCGFWHHHFLRAGILRKVFLSHGIGDDWGIREINVFNHKHAPVNNLNGSIVPDPNIIDFAEPCIKGQLTANAVRDMKTHGCSIPDYPHMREEKIFDTALRLKVERRRQSKKQFRKLSALFR